MSPAATWDKIYRTGTDWGREAPSDLVFRLVQYLPIGARVLDLGCGRGRNALLLGRLGFRVTAIDVSTVALKQLRTAVARENLLNVDVQIGDALDIESKEDFDLVLLYGILNSLPRARWPALLARTKRATRNGGLNAVVYFTSYSSKESVDGIEVLSLAEAGYATGSYRQWSPVLRDSRVEVHEHGNRPRHTHHVERVVFRKSPPPRLEAPPPSRPFTVSVVGPSNIEKASIAAMVPAQRYPAAAREVGKAIARAGLRLQCIPDGGVGLAAFSEYCKHAPLHTAQVLAPRDDPSLSSGRSSKKWLEALPCSADVKSQLGWEEAAPVLIKNTDLVVVVGLSAGTLIEILWCKWIRRPVLMSLDLCGRLPSDVRGDLALYEFATYRDMIAFGLSKRPPASFMAGA